VPVFGGGRDIQTSLGQHDFEAGVSSLQI
jgi:hypothetical protein